MKPVNIGNTTIGPGLPTYIIAEVSANHQQDFTRAQETVRAAAAAGVNAVKFQTYHPDLITFNSDSSIFRIDHGTTWDGRTLHSVYSEGYMPWDWHEPLFELAHTLGIDAFSSPFDPTAVDLLASLNVPAYKIASFEIVDIPLIEKVAQQGKPVIISTGIARDSDIEKAVAACRRMGNNNIIVLKCTSSYPAPPEELNLLTIPNISVRFNCLAGFSDHTLTTTAALGAVALGACVIERHITLDREDGGLDSTFSTTGREFAELVSAIRELELSLGTVTYELSSAGEESRRFSRSLFVVQDVQAGDTVTLENVRSIRPSDGLAPELLPELLGKTFTASIAAGTPLTLTHVESA
jgi:pseudaminic acid synthase